LSSNFGVIKRGVLYTSPKGTVLEGTTLTMILSICSDHGIPVVREFPNTDDWLQWEGAFVSSTTRGLLPINKIRIANGNYELELPSCPLLENLSSLLDQEMKKNSVDVSSSHLED